MGQRSNFPPLLPRQPHLRPASSAGVGHLLWLFPKRLCLRLVSSRHLHGGSATVRRHRLFARAVAASSRWSPAFSPQWEPPPGSSPVAPPSPGCILADGSTSPRPDSAPDLLAARWPHSSVNESEEERKIGNDEGSCWSDFNAQLYGAN